MLWFLRGIRKGIVTTRYPAATDSWAAQLPTPPAFRGELLTSELADKLVSACAPGALTRAEGELVLDLGACTACGRCRDVGGDAVTSSGEFELAAGDRTVLVKRIRIGAGR